jgi:hypothetical protein
MLDKEFINGYLGEDMYDQDEIDPKVLNRDYKSPQLDKSAYQEFWEGVSNPKLQRLSDSRGSQSVQRNVNMSPMLVKDGIHRNVSTPKPINGMLPQINQRRNTVKEPSVHTLDEDDYFGGSPMKAIAKK